MTLEINDSVSQHIVFIKNEATCFGKNKKKQMFLFVILATST
jgi:hypothetical protein